jgi:hypothetical protein
MKLTDADSMFATVMRTITNAVAGDPLDQATIDKCNAILLANAADIRTAFGAGGGFITWYNAKLASAPAFQHRGKIPATADVASRFDAFWDEIPAIFSSPKTTALEFAAVMCIGIQENSGDMSCDPEAVGRPPDYPHLVYAFEAIPQLKSSYNVNSDLGNWTALKLFQDQNYVAEHSALPCYHRVVDGGINQAWGSAIWPTGFAPDENAAMNGFVMEADFYKFRGRGVIQTTGRSDYSVLIQYILDNAASLGSATLSQLKATWDSYSGTPATKLDVIASRSTDAQWNLAFGEGAILAAAIAEDSRVKSNYLQLATDAKTLNGGTTTKGSLYFMARKINAGSYPDTVVPMMKAMIRGIASL